METKWLLCFICCYGKRGGLKWPLLCICGLVFALALGGGKWLILLFPIWQHCGENGGQWPLPGRTPQLPLLEEKLLVSLFIETPRGKQTACRHTHKQTHTHTDPVFQRWTHMHTHTIIHTQTLTVHTQVYIVNYCTHISLISHTYTTPQTHRPDPIKTHTRSTHINTHTHTHTHTGSHSQRLQGSCLGRDVYWCLFKNIPSMNS